MIVHIYDSNLINQGTQHFQLLKSFLMLGNFEQLSCGYFEMYTKKLLETVILPTC